AASAAWSVDQVTPETTIGSGPADPIASHSATFSFSADLPGCTFECALDAAAFAACSSPVTYDHVGDGSHTLRVRATTAAHDVDPTPAGYTWTIDTTGPTTTITSGPQSGGYAGAAVTFTFTSEPGATFECALDSDPFGACSGDGRHDLID